MLAPAAPLALDGDCWSPLHSAPLAAEPAALLARRFAALSDPVRLRLVSHHLKVLREAGLVASEKRGTNVWYAVVPAALESLRIVLGPVPGPAGG